MAQQSVSRYNDVRELYYITHVDNLSSILRQGIFSHEQIHTRRIQYTKIYNEEIVTRRQKIRLKDGRSLWSFTNLYFSARNPMLFKVRCDKPIDDIIVLGISPEILSRNDIYVTTGNAAHSESRILTISEGRSLLPKIVEETRIRYWREEDGSKRKIMAECLIPDVVPAKHIESIYVGNHKVRPRVEKSFTYPYSFSIVCEPDMFFRPTRTKILRNTRISLLEGDMFFSRMQTLTVSVNVVGVMGAGLASRAKYQFPGVHVKYLDACRNGQLKMGKPYLYKRESSADHDLADEPFTLRKARSTWFLLFPTKRHFRERADINAIEKGLQWICENHEKEGIKELALPALGCGLGMLKWEDVGPLMCRYLSTLKKPVSIYLPTERRVPDELLTEEFLLHRKSPIEGS